MKPFNLKSRRTKLKERDTKRSKGNEKIETSSDNRSFRAESFRTVETANEAVVSKKTDS